MANVIERPQVVAGTRGDRTLLAAERHQRIMEILRERRSASVAELAQELGTSQSTINRDLSTLTDHGWIWRVRGGATYLAGSRTDPPAKGERLRRVREKEAIGEAAAELVTEGQVVFLEASTTVASVARHLRQLEQLTVVTNDVFIAAELSDCAGFEVIVTGGLLRQSTLALVGPLVEQLLDSIHVDVVITGISALSPEHGLSTGNLLEAQTKKRLLRSSGLVIGVADHSKFGTSAFVRLGPVSDLDVLVTDDLAPAEDVAFIQELGTRVIVAPVPDREEVSDFNELEKGIHQA